MKEFNGFDQQIDWDAAAQRQIWHGPRSSTPAPARLHRAGRIACALAIVLQLCTSAVQAQADSILAQGKLYARDLASPAMFGRGYQKEGHTRAANMIAAHFENFGLVPVPGKGGSPKPYFQPVRVTVNLVEGEQAFALDGKPLQIGKDYIIHESSSRCKFENAKIKDIGHGMPDQFTTALKGSVIMLRSGLPEKYEKDPELKKQFAKFAGDDVKLDFAHKMQVKAVIFIKPKLTAGLSQMPIDLPVVEVLATALPKKKSKKCSLTINIGIKTTNSQNVVAILPGGLYPDSVVIVSAHYDHLGTQGDAIFFGGNDNASGTSMLLSMAEYYARMDRLPPYTMMFIAFTGEEAGLVGSQYYATKEPLFPLSKTKFILNLDLMANGDEGITAVAGLDYPEDFAALQALNTQLSAVPIVKGRPNAPNSDHYWFVKNGVKGMFIYTLGGPPHYHDVNDTYEAMRFSKYVEVRDLLIAFLNWEMGKR
jgi:aminopeptidase YwaD